MFVKLVSTAINLFGATFLFWAGIAFEHRPAGWPNLALTIGPFHPVLRLPDGPYARLASVNRQLSGWIDAAEDAKRHAAAVEAHDARVTTTIAAVEQTAQAAIAGRASALAKDIPAHVTPEIDRRYPLSVGFVRLHDAAALGIDLSEVGDAPGLPDDAASSIGPSAAIAAIAANYADCHADAQQLSDWQAWYRGIAAGP